MTRGLAAEFDTEDAIVEAVRGLVSRGYSRVDACSPFPSARLVSALELPRSNVPWIVLIGGLLGATIGYLILYWTSAVDYPLDVGGRPAHAAPAFIPITFESAVLLGAVSGFAAFLYLARIPRLYHPTMEIDGFGRATSDRFWLTVDADDARYDEDRTEGELRQAGALRVERFGEEEGS